MIKMTDNTENNSFDFFCDVCGKEISDIKTGEVLFENVIDAPVIPVFTHYACSKVYEQTNECGNMRIDEFIESLVNRFDL